ncbi:MAG: hypothetical protein JOZ51_20190, partial [Chloroflexi bacterium]|nr:hypothetical protein [Chloroflexota bacterium]
MFTQTNQHTRAALISGEPRTHVRAHQEDLVALRSMQAELHRVSALVGNDATSPQTTHVAAPGGRQHRIV